MLARSAVALYMGRGLLAVECGGVHYYIPVFFCSVLLQFVRHAGYAHVIFLVLRGSLLDHVSVVVPGEACICSSSSYDAQPI